MAVGASLRGGAALYAPALLLVASSWETASGVQVGEDSGEEVSVNVSGEEDIAFGTLKSMFDTARFLKAAVTAHKAWDVGDSNKMSENVITNMENLLFMSKLLKTQLGAKSFLGECSTECDTVGIPGIDEEVVTDLDQLYSCYKKCMPLAITFEHNPMNSKECIVSVKQTLAAIDTSLADATRGSWQHIAKVSEPRLAKISQNAAGSTFEDMDAAQTSEWLASVGFEAEAEEAATLFHDGDEEYGLNGLGLVALSPLLIEDYLGGTGADIPSARACALECAVDAAKNFRSLDHCNLEKALFVGTPNAGRMGRAGAALGKVAGKASAWFSKVMNTYEWAEPLMDWGNTIIDGVFIGMAGDAVRKVNTIVDTTVEIYDPVAYAAAAAYFIQRGSELQWSRCSKVEQLLLKDDFSEQARAATIGKFPQDD